MDPYVRIQQALNLGMVDGVRERAREIDRPLAIAAVRTAFETFGDALITYAKERHAPYYGQTMSDCGRFVTDLPTVSQPPGSGQQHVHSKVNKGGHKRRRISPRADLRRSPPMTQRMRRSI
jgi:hypothetical protein